MHQQAEAHHINKTATKIMATQSIVNSSGSSRVWIKTLLCRCGCEGDDKDSHVTVYRLRVKEDYNCAQPTLYVTFCIGDSGSICE